MKAQKKILFFVERNLHLPFLEPVHDFIQQHYPEVDTCFSAPPYKLAMDGKTGYGIDDGTIKRLSEKSHFIHDIGRYKPDITVVADIGAAYSLEDCGSIVNVGHGLTSKGCFYTTRPTIKRENLADLICVPGKLHEQILLKNVFVPVKVTGFITSDYLYNNRRDLRKEFCRLHGIDENKKIILYAPTYNHELSAIPVLRETIFQIADSRHHIIIKLHGMTDRYWVDILKEKAAVNPDATFVSTGDIAPCLAAADLLISDVSSAYVEYMLLDKPIILVDNPDKTQFIHYDPDDIEYKLSDACTVVNSFEQLQTEVGKNLENPETYSRKRRLYAQAICYGQDGKAAQRAAEAIRNHLNYRFTPGFSILVFWDCCPSRLELMKFWQRLRRSTSGYAIEVIMVGPKPPYKFLTDLCRHWIECPSPGSHEMDKAIALAENEYIVFLRPDINLIQGWPKYLFCHFQWNTNVGLVQAITPDNGYEIALQRFFPESKNLDYPKISFLFNRFLTGLSIQSSSIDSTCFMIKKKSCAHLPPCDGFASIAKRLRELTQDILCRKQNILKCVDTFAYPVTSQ